MRLTDLWPLTHRRSRQATGSTQPNTRRPASNGTLDTLAPAGAAGTATAPNPVTTPRPSSPRPGAQGAGLGFMALLGHTAGMDDASQVAFFTHMLRQWDRASLVQLQGKLAHADAVVAAAEAGASQLNDLEERFESAEWGHEVAQRADPEMYPQTTAQFEAILRSIVKGDAAWRPKGHDAAQVLQPDDVEGIAPRLLYTTCGIALASTLPTLVATGGLRCGLDLVDAAWETTDRPASAAWQALAARVNKLFAGESLQELARRVAYVVETSDAGVWGNNPLVHDLARQVRQEVMLLPRQELLACLTAPLKRLQQG